MGLSLKHVDKLYNYSSGQWWFCWHQKWLPIWLMVNDVPGNSSPFPPKFFSILGLCLSTSLECPISRWRMVWVLLSIKTAVLLFAEKPKLKQIYTKFSNLIYFSCYPEVTTSFLFKVYTPNICNGNQFNMLIILSMKNNHLNNNW